MKELTLREFKRSERSTQERLGELQVESHKVIREMLSISPRNVIAFSGGKDALVLTHMLQQYDVRDAVAEMSFVLKPSADHVRKSAKRYGLNMHYEYGLSWDWLAKNPQYVEVPRNKTTNLYSIRQQRTIKRTALLHGYTGIFTGRRKSTNTTRKPIYKLKAGTWTAHPLREWQTRDIWTYIEQHNISVPDIYSHEIGEVMGHHPYLMPPVFSKPNMEMLWEVDPDAVRELAKFYPPAKAVAG